MKLLVVNQNEVKQLLPMADCIEVMAKVLRDLAAGEAQMPLRQVLDVAGGKGAFASMPSYLKADHALGLKVITVFPGNEGTDLDSHQGAVLLFESVNGRLLAIMDASSITAIRTAAVSGVATNLLARQDAQNVAIIGSGVQAATHLEAMLSARSVRQVRVYSRSYDHAKEFADKESRLRKVSIQPCKSAREAAADADIICTVTSSREPVLASDWVRAGTHINAVGAFGAAARELESSLVARSRFFVDRRESAMNEAGEFLIPLQEGVITNDHILAELGELLLSSRAGRISNDDITVFKSLGLAVEDAGAAKFIYDRAIERRVGSTVEFGGARL